MIERTPLDPEPGVDYGAPFRPWPAVCGTPVQLSFDLAGYAYRLHNIGEGGLVRVSNTLRFEPGPEPPVEPAIEPPPVSTYDWRDRGCSLSQGPAPSSSAPAWLALSSALALALMRRGQASVKSRSCTSPRARLLPPTGPRAPGPSIRRAPPAR